MPFRRVFAALSLAPLVALAAQVPRALTVTRDVYIDAETADLASGFGAALSRSGDFFLGQGHDHVIRVFGTSGPKSSIGHKGAGPGEFASITTIGFVGDTLWALDEANSRISFFSGPTYKLARSLKVPVAMPPINGVTVDIDLDVPTPMANGDLRAVASHSGNAKHLPAWYLSTDTAGTILVRTDSLGTFRKHLIAMPPSKCEVHFTTRYGSGGVGIPFCNDQLNTAESGGEDVLTASIEQRPGAAAVVRVALVDGTGATLFTRTLATTPVAVAKGAYDSMIVDREKFYKRTPPEARAAFAKAKIPKTYPPVRAMFLGRDGTSWIEMRIQNDAHMWYLLDAKGATIGTVTVPANVTLRAADARVVWGTEMDGDGAEGVVRYRFVR